MRLRPSHVVFFSFTALASVTGCSSSSAEPEDVTWASCRADVPPEGQACATGDYLGCDATTCSVSGVASGHRYACVGRHVKYTAPSDCGAVCPADRPLDRYLADTRFVGTCAMPFPAKACAASAAAGVVLTFEGATGWQRSDRSTPTACPASQPKTGDPCGCEYLPDTFCRYGDCAAGAEHYADVRCDFSTGTWSTSVWACHDAGP